jgi:hypothetical protein
LDIKENEILKFPEKWIELNDNKLNEISQREEIKCIIQSLICTSCKHSHKMRRSDQQRLRKEGYRETGDR